LETADPSEEAQADSEEALAVEVVAVPLEEGFPTTTQGSVDPDGSHRK
jgi:hypothetical protein